MIRVLIADDHAILRHGLRLILEAAGDMEVAGEAENGIAVMQLLRERPVDVLLLDVAMPGRGGFDVLQRVVREYPKMAVLILSMYPEEQYAVRLLRAGAAGYLTKETAPKMVVNAIRHVALGKKYITPGVAELLADQLHGKDTDLPHQRLSDREYQVLCEIASGKTVTQIAEQMLLSDRTVSTYRNRILDKMHMETNAQLTHYAIKHGLVQ